MFCRTMSQMILCMDLQRRFVDFTFYTNTLCANFEWFNCIHHEANYRFWIWGSCLFNFDFTVHVCLFYDLYDCIQKNYLQFVSWLFMMLIRYADLFFSITFVWYESFNIYLYMFCSNVWHALYVEKSDVKFTYDIHLLYFKIKAKTSNLQF